MQEIPWAVLLFPLSFAVLWLVVTGGLSKVSGWGGLAQRFAAGGAPLGERFRFVSGAIGASGLPVGYRNCLVLDVAAEGFGLSLLFLFRFLSPPLFIPWREVESIGERRLWLQRSTEIVIRGSATRVRLHGSAGQSAARAFAAYTALA
jgi:hypothetical protein